MPSRQAVASIENNVEHSVRDKVLHYDHQKNCTDNTSGKGASFNYLTYFNCGMVSVDTNGSVSREFTLIVQENQRLVVSTQGNTFEGWTFNGTIPGPTIRVTEGDHIKIALVNSQDSQHSHSLHMHSIHPASMDGVEHGIVPPGQNYTYEFIAGPFGVYPYHCHVEPIEDHINRGLYGMMIIDRKTPRPQMNEMVMMMNGYDLDYKKAEKESPFMMPKPGHIHGGPEERDNEIYSVNGKAFEYADNPINLTTGEPVRIYLVNMLEFDLVNSFHLHGNMFNYYPSGTSTKPEELNDIVTLSQGDRGIIEFTPKYPGRYMFHAHQTEFTDKGWMGFFNVADVN
jgi:FtsP/CotA-like multicopper oxidase with cupredoxin domain